jgi:hypothetical protein
MHLTPCKFLVLSHFTYQLGNRTRAIWTKPKISSIFQEFSVTMERRSSRPLAATNYERRNPGAEAVRRRPAPPRASNLAFSAWENMTAPKVVSPIIEDDEATTPKRIEKFAAGVFNEEQMSTAPVAIPQASSKFVVRRSNSRVSVSPPSAAAIARRGQYMPWRVQSAYRPESSTSRDRERDRGRDWDRDRRWDRNRNTGPVLFDAQTTRSIKIPKWGYSPGMIVRALIHEPGLRGVSGVSTATIVDRYTTDSKFGAICSKYRKMIVINTYEDHYLAIPLYTHNGRGLDRKSKPDEFVSVRDHRQTEPFHALSAHRPLVTERLTPGIDLYDPKSTAHITFPVSRRYELPVVHEGYLHETSTKMLLQLVGMNINSPPPVSRQG